jgi:uncharacterized delta-60 repeat protein
MHRTRPYHRSSGRHPASWVSGAVLGVSIALFTTLVAHAAAGDLDPAFDGDGIRTVSFANSYSYADDVAVQADGKILALGTAHSSVGVSSDFGLVRLRPGGALDPKFGGDGRIQTDFGGRYDEGFALALQSNGRIVAAGSSLGLVSIARYLSNGRLDHSFGDGGKRLIDLGVDARARDVAIQPDGKIVVAVEDSWTFTVLRLRSNGRFDRTFGDDGIVSQDFSPGSTDWTRAVAIQDDGGILLGGGVLVNYETTKDDWGLARFDESGVLDAGFGDGGLATTDFAANGPDVLEDLVLQPDGMIVATGQSSVDPGTADQSSDVTVARYDEHGVLDPDFGTGGFTRTDLGSYFDDGRSVALGPDGTIAVAADRYEEANNQAAVVRYTSAGVADPSFGGGDGIATVDTPSTSDQAFGVAVQTDGRIVIAGTTSIVTPDGTSFDFLFARFLGP